MVSLLKLYFSSEPAAYTYCSSSSQSDGSKDHGAEKERPINGCSWFTALPPDQTSSRSVCIDLQERGSTSLPFLKGRLHLSAKSRIERRHQLIHPRLPCQYHGWLYESSIDVDDSHPPRAAASSSNKGGCHADERASNWTHPHADRHRIHITELNQ